MVNIAEIILNIFNIVFIPMELIASWFWYCESFLRTLTVGIVLILSLGKILSFSKKVVFKCIKYFLYIYYLFYTVWSLGIFTNLLTLNFLEWSTFLLSVVAPICMIVVGRIAKNSEIKGYKVFTYPIIMLLYIFIAWLWFFIAPKTLNFTVLFYVWLFVFIVVGAIWIMSYFSGGEQIAKK